MDDTRLIALDWGTSSLRAYRLGANGVVLEQRALPWGIMNLPTVTGDDSRQAGFASAFAQACGDWLQAAPATPLIAAGMVGSAQGWREATYVDTPLAIRDIGHQLASVEVGGGHILHIVPGLLQRSTLPNVIRGEETQVVGALAAAPDAQDVLIGLPGTHCKWVRVEQGRITHFDTYMTGEVYAALSQHTILGRTMERNAAIDQEAFVRGLAVAQSADGRAGVLSTIFSSRTLGLVGQLSPAAQAEYLSGLLIGHEVAALVAMRPAAKRIILIGDAKLCARYQSALALHGWSQAEIAAGATERGLWHIAAQAGLLART